MCDAVSCCFFLLSLIYLSASVTIVEKVDILEHWLKFGRASLPPNSLHSCGNSALTLKTMLVTAIYIKRYYKMHIFSNLQLTDV